MQRASRLAQVCTLTCLALLARQAVAHAQPGPPGQPAPNAVALRTLSLEELGKLVVTSVSKTEETRSTAAAAVAVITSDDIRRSGATTIPGLLRLVPGLHVARQTSNIWAVSSRGFSSGSSEKLLVLTDTRSIYTPLYSGVFWDAQDLMLEDVARIEVIRGPGAALWGSNAVNGVINITSKSAAETQGAYAAVSGGNEERFAVNGRYGGRIGETAYYRVFGKFTARDATFFTGTARDDWQLGRGGARMDWYANATNTVTLQGDVYGGEVGRLFPSISLGAARPSPVPPLNTDISGGNVLGRWSRRSAPGAETQVRVYYDRTHRNDPSFIDDLDTVDADLQHRMPLRARQELTFGANYRFTSNRNQGKGVFALDPPSSSDQVYSGFVQHQVELTNTLRLTSGTKLEHNDFSGGDVQPSVRAAWNPVPAHTVWGAVSRAVRIPTRLERDLAVDASNPAGRVVVRLLGNPDFDSERLVAYEAGYRWQHSTLLFVDLATYHNRYRGLASLEQGAPFTSGSQTIVPITNQNLTDGNSSGLEAAVTVAPTPWWRLSANSTTTSLDLTARGADLNRGVSLEGATPRHQFLLRSQLDLGTNVDVDAQLRHATRIRRLPASMTDPLLPGYAELDLRVAWRPTRGIEAAIVGQSLLHDHHPEFGVPGSRGEIERGVYASLTWRR
jgi:iron complex outermembrane receptor protein